ncbi:MAG: alpha/beta fold hydrolase [Rhodospirillales bacterium]|nr:alpha/beta fold hydrolase [Rhodospirillales bacterium]
MLFPTVDQFRRAQGRWLETLGYGPRPSPSWTALETAGMRLMAYQAGETVGPPLLLVPAPIKRAYIFDLVERASVVRRCRERGRAVFLVEWLDPDGGAERHGLADYADRMLLAAAEAARAVTGRQEVVLLGHSLGGTLAALHAARRPEGVAALVLLEAPLLFDPAIDLFAPWLRTPPFARRLVAGSATVAGSELTLAAVAAAPDAFLWHRWGDAVAGLSDPQRQDLHMRVLRWALDEIALPAPLLSGVLESLYRGNEFRDGKLDLSGVAIGLADIVAPLLAVIESESRVVPSEEVLPALRATSSPSCQVLTHDSDAGVALAHVGVLVGAEAHQRLWPRILDWIAETAP